VKIGESWVAPREPCRTPSRPTQFRDGLWWILGVEIFLGERVGGKDSPPLTTCNCGGSCRGVFGTVSRMPVL
jgi:hypothetical protein